MKTRSSHNWFAEYGNRDPLHFQHLLEAGNEFDIPNVDKFGINVDNLPEKSLPYNMYKSGDVLLHFFMDDYRFETLWRRPSQATYRIQRAGSCCSPDFSLYPSMPKAMQIWNVYRNRWMCKSWQDLGLHVIPTVGWSNEESYEYCFLGIPEGSTVALSTFGIKKVEFEGFEHGYREMVRQIAPKQVVCLGLKYQGQLEDINSNIKVKYYPSFWDYKTK